MIWPGSDTQSLYLQQQTNYVSYATAKEQSTTASVCLRGEGDWHLSVTLVVSITALEVRKFKMKAMGAPKCLAAVPEGRV